MAMMQRVIPTNQPNMRGMTRGGERQRGRLNERGGGKVPGKQQPTKIEKLEDVNNERGMATIIADTTTNQRETQGS